MTTEGQISAWDTETGLVNDIDAWIANPSFGVKEEYAQKLTEIGAGGGEMFMFDLVDENGEIVGSQGYSIGTGWIISDDGMAIEHPKRKNVVSSSMYGMLQNRVAKELKVDMDSRGLPTEAKSWDGLGFHWMQEPHMTVGGQEATSVMPVEFLGEKKPSGKAGVKAAPAKTTPAATVAVGTAEKALGVIARSSDLSTFQEKALAMQSVANNDALMAQVLDEGPEGFWATHQEK